MAGFFYLCSMKYRGIAVFLFFAVLLAACHRPAVEMQSATSPQQPSALAAVDTLLWTQPDSALTRLLQCYDKVDDRHYANLLLSELLYKNYYEQTNRTKLLQAVAYYDSVSSPFLAARAHYINGVGYYERDSVVSDCKEYLKALENMEEHFAETELVGKKAQFMAMTYTRLTDIFSDQYLHEQAIYFGKQSLGYYYRYDVEPWHIAWMLDEIGSHYTMIEQWDSAEYYYDKAIEILPDTNNLTFRDVISAQSLLCYYQTKQQKAIISRLKQMLTLSESEHECLSRCMLIGEIYYQEGVWDSAFYYLNQVFNATEQVDSKILTAQYLQNICLKTGDSLLINNYILYLSRQTDVGDAKASLHSQLTDLCLVFSQGRNEAFHRQQNKRLLKFWAAVVVFLFSAVAITTSFFIKFKKRDRKQKETMKKQMEAERKAHAVQQAALSGKLKKSNWLLRETTRQLESYNSLQATTFNKETTVPDLNAFKESSVCKEKYRNSERYLRYWRNRADG